MLDLGRVDLDEIAAALADQTDYEHRWLINPRTGEVAFWTSDTGIDGQHPVDLDDLDLVCIEPLPSNVWYQDMADFAERISDNVPGAGWRALSTVEVPFAGSRPSCTRSIHICYRPGTPSARAAAGGGLSSGSPKTRSSTTTQPEVSSRITQILNCPEPPQRDPDQQATRSARMPCSSAAYCVAWQGLRLRPRHVVRVGGSNVRVSELW